MANSQTPPEAQNRHDSGLSSLTNPPTKPPLAPLSSANRDGMFALDVEVTDSAGNPVPALDAKNFTLLDNDQPTRVFTFYRSPSPGDSSDPFPLLILVFDELNLSAQQLSQARQAAAAFLRGRGGILAQPVFLYRITSDGLFSSVRSSLDGNELAEQVAKKKIPRAVWQAGSTNPATFLHMDYEALRNFLSIRALGSIAIDQRENTGRKVMVWFGNGWPVNKGERFTLMRDGVPQGGNFGFEEQTELSTRLREARITLNTASGWPDSNPRFDHLDMPESAGPARLSLQVIATNTGGQILESSNDLQGDIERFAADAGAFYHLTFDPPRTDRADEYHSLKVVVSIPGLSARTAAGYYDQPVYFDHPRPGTEKVTAAQLDASVRKSGDHAGADLARRLSNMELTERLAPGKLDDLLGSLHAERDRQALVALADLAEFLPLPAADIPVDTPPDKDGQLEILRRTFDYLANAIHTLPDFFATRTAVMYEEPKAPDDVSWKVSLPDQTLHVGFTARGTVLYRNGVEVVDDEVSNRKRAPGKPQALDRTSGPVLRERTGREHSLDTRGTFGPMLASVLQAAANGQSSLNWSRWERSKNGNLAVFRFVVPQTTPIFEVTFCCLPEGDGTTLYRIMTGYHGEFAVDPASGALLRLAIEADLDEDRDPEAPIIRSALMVEYGPVEIAGSPYICPRRSVSLSRGRTLRELHEWGMNFIVYAPFETMLNDFTFGEYHKFGSESRMLTGFEEIPDTSPPKSGVSQRPTKPQ